MLSFPWLFSTCTQGSQVIVRNLFWLSWSVHVSLICHWEVLLGPNTFEILPQYCQVIFHVKWPHFYLASELLNVFSHFLHKQRPVAQHLDIFKMWTNTKIPSGKSTFCDLELFPTIDQAVPVDPGKSRWRISHCAAWQGHRLWEKVSF